MVLFYSRLALAWRATATFAVLAVLIATLTLRESNPILTEGSALVGVVVVPALLLRFLSFFFMPGLRVDKTGIRGRGLDTFRIRVPAESVQSVRVSHSRTGPLLVVARGEDDQLRVPVRSTSSPTDLQAKIEELLRIK